MSRPTPTAASTAQARMELYRVGDLLQAIWYKYKEHVFYNIIGAVGDNTEILYVHFREDLDIDESFAIFTPGLPSVFSFPKNLNVSEEDRLALSVFLSCDEAVAATGEALQFLLDGICTEMDEVMVMPNNPSRPVVQVDENGFVIESPVCHSILSVALANGGGDYILDFSGAQYGWFDPVTPFEYYIHNCVVEGDQRPIFKAVGYSMTWLEGHIQTLTESPDHKLQMAVYMETFGFIITSIKWWLNKHQMSVQTFRQMEERDYQSAKSEIVESFEDNVLAALRNLGQQSRWDGRAYKGFGLLEN